MKPILGTGDRFVDWRTKTNQISENVGDPDDLVTNDKSSLAAAVNSSVALLDGNLAKTTTGGTTTLTASEFSNGVITVDGVLVSDATIVVPDVVHKFILTNETTGTFKLEVKTSAQVKAVEIEQGSSASLYCDASNVVLVGGAGSGNTTESELPPEDPEAGDKWIKISTRVEYTWMTNSDLSGQWVESAAVMNTYSTLRFYEQTATEGQTLFTVAYTPGFIVVYMNGYRLSPSDYVATNGTAVVLNVPALAGDELLFEVMGTFAIANAVTPAMLANELKYINGAYLTEVRMVAPNFPTPAGWVNISYSQPSFHPVAGMASEFISSYYCGDDNNAAAAFGFRCDNIDGTGRNPDGDYIALEPAANRFYRGMDDTGSRDPWQLHEDQMQRITGSSAVDGATGLLDNSAPVSGAFTKGRLVGSNRAAGQAASGYALDFDSGLVARAELNGVDETVPKHIDKKFIMKVADGAVGDPALVDWQAYLDAFTDLSASKLNKADDDNRTVMLYPGGTEASPATISANQRVVIDNPFPGHYVQCEAQIQVDGKWGSPGAQVYDANANSGGVVAAQLMPDESVVVQSGRNYLTGGSFAFFNPFGLSGGSIATAPFRVIVTRLGKIQ